MLTGTGVVERAPVLRTQWFGVSGRAKTLNFQRVSFLLIALNIVGCTSTNDATTRVELNTAFEQNVDLITSIRQAERLILHEGLPHQEEEAELLAKEKRTKPTRMLHGFPFYRESAKILAADEAELQRVLGSESSFEKSEGVRLCGGFHPDYAVEWGNHAAVFRMLICFGCEEINVYGPDRSLYCVLKREPAIEVRKLLQTYRKNRPLIKQSAK